MNPSDLAGFKISPRADCPQCGEKIEINQWSLVCGFKMDENSTSVKVDAKHLALTGVEIIGVCEKCTQKNNGIKTGVFVNLNINEFFDFVVNNIVRFISDFNNGTIEVKDASFKKIQ